ncbi:unnamed protein product [Paramecium sonneborni]|uniref:Pru domain-containing protein n=1 Tax=Paramecium sonneborni TaxID=65129 RepID=A0A8S1N2Y2_9CILI|nr:unnamed protein product [Paramecium sonneborni]
MNQEVKIPCGRFDYNSETKKVVMIKSKGLLNLILNDENELCLKWYNLDSNNRLELERIIFKGTTIFEKVKGQYRVYLLKITDEDSKYFFWMQQNEDVSQDEKQIKKFNDIVNSQIIDNLSQLEEQLQISSEQPEYISANNRMCPNIQSQPLININSLQLLDLLQQQLYKYTNKDLELVDILSNDFLLTVSQDEDYFEALKKYLPIDQQSIQYFKENLISPQFKQAIDQLCLALKGREQGSVLQQLELDSTILQNEFDGVIAFVQAIIKLVKDEKKNI